MSKRVWQIKSYFHPSEADMERYVGPREFTTNVVAKDMSAALAEASNIRRWGPWRRRHLSVQERKRG